MTRTALSLILAAALASTATLLPAFTATAAPITTHGQTAPNPAAQVREWVRLFRANDVAGLAQTMVPPSKWEQARLAYELAKLKPISDQDRAEFDEQLARFTGPDAVDRLMAEIEPKLDEARPQSAGALLMAFGAMQMAVSSPDSPLTEEQREALQQALPGIQTWASSTDFLDAGTLREALTLLTDAARRSGIDQLDAFRSLSLDGALHRAGPLLAASKQAALLYGIDLDAVADSLQVEVLSIDGDHARVRSTVMLFDAPVWAEHELVLIEGRWFGPQVRHDLHFDDEVEVARVD